MMKKFVLSVCLFSLGPVVSVPACDLHTKVAIESLAATTDQIYVMTWMLLQQQEDELCGQLFGKYDKLTGSEPETLQLVNPYRDSCMETFMNIKLRPLILKQHRQRAANLRDRVQGVTQGGEASALWSMLPYIWYQEEKLRLYEKSRESK